MTELREALERILQMPDDVGARYIQEAISDALSEDYIAASALSANPPSPAPAAGSAEVRGTPDNGWQCPHSGVVYSAGYLAKLLNDRDTFIVAKGLWGEFCDTAFALDALSALPVPDDGWRPTHRHMGRGTSYQVVAEGYLQTTALIGTAADDEHVTLYRGEDGRWWVRPTDEFNDGRFEPLPPPPGQEGTP